MRRSCGYLQGNLEHHLDHLAPFCSLMEWPLIVTDEELFRLANIFYPDLEVHWINCTEAPFEVAQKFDRVVTTLSRIAFDDIFQIAMSSLEKRIETWWLPHGNSDKGHLLPWMEALQDEEVVLVYGQKMMDFLRQKKVFKPKLMSVGNFRYLYFQKHREFYNQLLDTMGLPKEFVLYAPTWNDAENSGSFGEAIDEVLKIQSPLVVKPHPNQAEDPLVLQKKLQTSCYWLDHFPPIYPLLDRTSHLIGDFSSIGYDFLIFNRSMLFFNPRQKRGEGRFLHQCGQEVTNNLQAYINEPFLPSSRMEQLAAYTFGGVSTWPEKIKNVKRFDNG